MSKYRPTKEELIVQLSKLSKKADRRMRELEKLAKTDEFKSATRFAYRRAAKDAALWGGNPEKPRFDIKIDPEKMKVSQIQAKIHDIESFLEKPTSTKTGIINVYKKAADKLNSEYEKENLNITWDQLKTFFESETYKNMEKVYGSDVAIKAIAKIKRNRMTVYKAIKRHQEAHITTEKDPDMVKEAIKDSLKNYGSDVKELLGEI